MNKHYILSQRYSDRDPLFYWPQTTGSIFGFPRLDHPRIVVQHNPYWQKNKQYLCSTPTCHQVKMPSNKFKWWIQCWRLEKKNTTHYFFFNQKKKKTTHHQRKMKTGQIKNVTVDLCMDGNCFACRQTLYINPIPLCSCIQIHYLPNGFQW